MVRSVHRLQTWVALPNEAEETEPSFQHAARSDIPLDTHGRSTVRAAAGSGWGLDAPVTGSSPLILAEVTLEEGSAVLLSSDRLDQRFPTAPKDHEPFVLCPDENPPFTDRAPVPDK